MARQGKGGDPGANKYQTTFAKIPKKVAAVPKEPLEQAEEVDADKPEQAAPKRKIETPK